MVTDHYYEKWNIPQTVPYNPLTLQPSIINPITQAEVDEFRKLLERAREYDKKNGEPDCELKEKKDKLLKLAEELSIKIDFL